MDASISATAPKIENIAPNRRCCQNPSAFSSSIVFTWKIGSDGSDAWISSTALVICAGPPLVRIVRPAL